MPLGTISFSNFYPIELVYYIFFPFTIPVAGIQIYTSQHDGDVMSIIIVVLSEGSC